MKRVIVIYVLMLISNVLLSQYAEIKLTALYGIPVQDYLQAESRFKNSIEGDSRSFNALSEVFFGQGKSGKVPDEVNINLKVIYTWGARFETRTGLSGMGVEVLTKSITIGANYIDPRTQSKVIENQMRTEGSVVPYYSLHPFQKRFSPNVFDVFFNAGIGYRWGYIYNTKTKLGVTQGYKQRVLPIAITARAGLTYYPIKPLGLTIDAGLGLNTINVGLVFRAADL